MRPRLGDEFRNLSCDGVDLDIIDTSYVDKEYNKNAYGFYMSDIASLNNATSQQEYQMILNRLVERSINEPSSSSKSVSDMIMEINPRYSQTPAELERAALFVGAHLERKIAEARASQLAEQARQAEVTPASPAEPSVNVTTT